MALQPRCSFRKLFLTLTIVVGVNCSLFSAHFWGGSIYYECLGAGSYRVSLEILRDCSGTTFGGQTLTFQSDCGPGFNIVIPSSKAVSSEVSQLCATSLGSSTCNAGALPGVQKLVYDTVVTLAPACDAWTVSWTTCCRSTGTLINAIGNDIYIEAVINNATAGCNSAPYTTHPFIAGRFCQDQQAEYNFGFVDMDADSMNFTLVGARLTDNTDVAFLPGYSAVSPIGSMSINRTTGHMSFFPTLSGTYVVNVKVDDFDASGNLLGTVYRDVLFFVAGCVNEQPTADIVSNLTGDAILQDTNAIRTCPGNSFCFDVVFTDADAVDVLALSSNVDDVLPGAAVLITGTNPVTANICWTAPLTTEYYRSFSISCNDSVCPIQGLGDATVEIIVGNGTNAGPDVTICGAQSADLTAIGGTEFTWTVFVGDPMVVGGNFSCDTCQNSQATPSVTTQYIVTTDLPANCPNQDTIEVSVVPAFTQALTRGDTTYCFGESDNVSTTPNPPAVYVYQWLGDLTFGAPATASTSVMMDFPGSQYIYSQVTSPLGCVMTDSLIYDVANVAMPDISISADDSAICNGTPVTLTSANVAVGPSCDYKLYMNDSWGDGWNGAYIMILVNTIPYGPFTISGPGPGAIADSAVVSVPDGADVELQFFAGPFDWEITFDLYNGAGGIAFSDGPSPTPGSSWTGKGDCGLVGSGMMYSWKGPNLGTPMAVNTTAFPTSSYNYILVAGDTAFGCLDTATVYIAVGGWNGISAVDVTPASCEVDNGIIDIVAGGMIAPITTSIDGGVTWSGMVSYSSLPLGFYHVMVQDSIGCSHDTVVEITNTGSPIPTISKTDESCAGNCDGSIYATASGGSGSGYVWTWNNNQGGGAVHVQLCSGIYSYVLQDGFGCETYGTVDILGGIPFPMATFSSAPPTVNIDIGQAANFINTTAGASSYLWDFGDGDTTTVVNPNHIYTYPDSFVVTLIAYNYLGCSDTVRNTVVAEMPSSVTERELTQVQVIPNPSTGIVRLMFEMPLRHEHRVIITDQLGKVVQQRSLQNGLGSFELDLSSFGNGLYHLNCYSRDEVISRKLIISR